MELSEYKEKCGILEHAYKKLKVEANRPDASYDASSLRAEIAGENALLEAQVCVLCSLHFRHRNRYRYHNHRIY